ncbi:sarcosine oxidase subunit delta [Neptuniibacter pectenicola]|jgi:sarcosine oxidase subunit delta|uniref:sarcosine oxidase subunit delta n=1 Tax=Neptuniibacter pectenicola TaxID=1806669 RepID=UPI00079804EA|nr:sarcosine oxidase subunit delta [Neptuniibacter pectenicola]KXJ56484.1 MAG: sarcosine oxidase subunit delta [Neptuniibacter sp. Phe_28]|eukprot:gnl/Carplike_NY0171/21946_a36833_73.p1 GENE.gnl/Carplike_NY0171/21946_a36833_73~~gnl/Carplike_NY0171/21946_a36833_73.p1  ORF type:complete len:101 (-),score=3.86 gnl/Carplike_NY0171/21946_a36833_73:213-515(-)
MKMMNCPLNGLRNISEFVHGGEVKEMPDPNSCSDDAWAEYVFYTENGISVVTEWWLHAPSGYWFIAERHTGSDEILKTYDPSVLFNKRVEFSAPVTEGMA